MEQQQPKTLWQVVKGYFNVMPDKENEADTCPTKRTKPTP